ncbi:hypothetical protein CRM22_003267 [Opisthorchis felineus]|uniref:Uncharacterized protein n=1 Tax=Opisthorchis felineus TaxID=147828 RepID=A0A4S2M894_OPIFE|nr:hypothetical protein CRM22_003267 [Opisthorchis felineus]
MFAQLLAAVGLLIILPPIVLGVFFRPPVKEDTNEENIGTGETLEEEYENPDQISSQMNTGSQEQGEMEDTILQQTSEDQEEIIQKEEKWYSAYDITPKDYQKDNETDIENLYPNDQKNDQPVLDRLSSQLVDQMLDQQEDSDASNLDQVSSQLVELISSGQETDQPVLDRLSSQLVDQMLDQQEDSDVSKLDQAAVSRSANSLALESIGDFLSGQNLEVLGGLTETKGYVPNILEPQGLPLVAPSSKELTSEIQQPEKSPTVQNERGENLVQDFKSLVPSGNEGQLQPVVSGTRKRKVKKRKPKLASAQ